jgi:hypothetical protein
MSRDTQTAGIVIASSGGGLGYLILQVLLPAGIGMSTGYGEDRTSAFLTYNKSLQRRLALEEEEETSPPPASPPAAGLERL